MLQHRHAKLAAAVAAPLVVIAAFALGRLTAPDPDPNQPVIASATTGTTLAQQGTPGTENGGSPSTPSTPPTLPEGQVPTEPLPQGADLPALSTPPEQSLWAFPADAYEAGVRMEVEFEPYGLGPATYGPSIVARVDVSEALDETKKTPDLTGKNVVFLLGSSEIEAGGRYRGIAVTELREDRLILLLDQVEPRAG